jgi:hypothetical protein
MAFRHRQKLRLVIGLQRLAKADIGIGLAYPSLTRFDAAAKLGRRAGQSLGQRPAFPGEPVHNVALIRQYSSADGKAARYQRPPEQP